MRKNIYGIYGDDSIIFFNLGDAQGYIFNKYPEDFSTKDECMHFCDYMIWEKEIRQYYKLAR